MGGHDNKIKGVNVVRYRRLGNLQWKKFSCINLSHYKIVSIREDPKY